MRKYVFKKRWKRAVMTALDAVGSALFFFYGMFRKKGRQKRVLVLRLDQIGDMIQAMPFFGSLRKKYPGYEVHVLCVRDCYFLLDNNPDIDAVHALSSSWFYKERAFDRKEFAGKIRQLRALEFEAAYDLRGDIRNIWTLVRAGAGKIYGYGSGGGGFMLDKEFDYGHDEHEMDKNLKLIGEKSPDAIRMEFHTTQAQDKEARDIIEAAGAAGAGMVAVHPFTRAQSKMWGADKFGALIEKMTALSGVKVFILGGREDAAAAQKYASLPGVVNCAGKLSLGGTAALIKRCSVFVGNDSGPQYFAAYSGVRTCVIYGYTMNSNRWRPKVKKEDFTGLSVAVPCGPCESSVCINRKGHKCMEAISVDMVWERIKQWIM